MRTKGSEEHLGLRNRKQWVNGIKLYNTEYHGFYSLPNITIAFTSRIRITGHAACMKKMRNVHNVSAENPKGKRPHGRH
jgi:hypothetical protein